MKAARSGGSQARWIVLAVAFAVAGWAIVLTFGDSWTWHGGQSSEDREWLRGQLIVDEGVPVVLPVELPAGYQIPDTYGHGGPADGPINSTSVIFPPTENARAKNHLQDVDLCVEQAVNPGDGCTTDNRARTIVRTVDGARVVITLQDHNETNRVAWQRVPLTTDLEKVAWLK
jgi:hypothetical protein